MYDESIYTEVEKYLYVRTGRYRPMFPDNWEDGIQEGMIQAFRDVQDNVQPKLKLIRRAGLAAERYFQGNCENPFGKPHKSRDGLSSKRGTIEKVQAFLDEFIKLHDRKPTGTEVANAVGISNRSANMALTRIREGRVDHMRYHTNSEGERRKDYDYYNVVHLENYATKEAGSAGEARGWEYSPYIPLPTEEFESDSVERLALVETINRLSEKNRKVLYWKIFEGYNTGEVGRALGYTVNASQHGTKAIKNALNQYRTVVDPYSGECSKGHLRTPENTTLRQDSGGSYRRHCFTCKSKNGGQNKK